ncbi:MAG: YqaJ viral recombinase family protein [Candidatus Paceibacterota bacterium]
MSHKILDNIPTQQWVDARKQYIGGSEVSAALGQSSYQTPLNLWLVKTGRIEPIDSTPIMELGNLLENMISEKFTKTTGLKLRNISEPYQHPEHSFLRGNIDRQILSSEKHDGPGVLEIKSTTSYRLKNEDGLYPSDWDYQTQHYLMLTGYDYGYIAIFERDSGIFHEPILIKRDEQFIRQNTEKLIQWWTLHIQQDIAPDPINNEDMMLLFPDAKDGSVVEASPDSFEYYKELKRVREKISDLEYQKEVLEVFLKHEIRTAERLVVAGRDLITWKNQTTRRLDTTKIKQNYPALCKKFIKTTTSRRFVVK